MLHHCEQKMKPFFLIVLFVVQPLQHENKRRLGESSPHSAKNHRKTYSGVYNCTNHCHLELKSLCLFRYHFLHAYFHAIRGDTTLRHEESKQMLKPGSVRQSQSAVIIPDSTLIPDMICLHACVKSLSFA